MFLKKTLHNPAKKPSSHKARRTPHGDLHPAVCVRPPARPRACTGARTLGSGRARPGWSMQGVRRRRCSPGSWSMQRWVGRAAAAHLRDVFARIRRRRLTARVFAPQVRSNGSGCRGRPSGLGMHNNSARRCADRAVNRGRRRNVWGTGGRATASGQQSLSATAGFSQTRAPREQGPHELSGLQASMEVVQCGLRREGRRGASCNGRGAGARRAGARCRGPGLSVALLLVMEVPIPRCSQQCRM